MRRPARPAQAPCRGTPATNVDAATQMLAWLARARPQPPAQGRSMRRTRSRLVIARAVVALAILDAAGPVAHAQTPASPADAALAAQKAAFLALPESMRKAARTRWCGLDST